ncbi:MAG TPA: hypothetical protein VIJ93_11905 [bacterium]
MKINRVQILTGVFLLALALPAFAGHGPLASLERDSWINASLSDLVAAKLVAEPAKPIQQLTNFEVAQLTAQASQRLVQADILPPGDAAPPALPGSLELPGVTQGAKSLKDLLEEFKGELSAMGVDVDKLVDRMSEQRERNEVFAALQKEYLKRTGTEVGGLSRGYMNMFQGAGANAAYPPMDYNAAIFMEMDLKSVPIPFVLFDARLRFWRSIGMYYQDPIQPEYQLRWISLSNVNDYVNLTAGDFFKSYTPLTLWNNDSPLYTLIEPTSFSRARKDVEELLYLDHAPDWHLRGFQLSGGREWAKDFLSGFDLQAMAGTLQDATPFTYGSYYAGSQGSLRLLNDNLELKGTGLLLWQDSNSANVPYLPDFPSTFAKQYQIGSLSSRLTIPVDKEINVEVSTEAAFTQYNDDANDPQRTFQDSAILGKGAVNLFGVHLTAKYLNNGPYFYSPGAQTNRFTPAAGSQGYLSTNLYGIDDALPGYRNGFVFQDVNRPSFAPYDRLSENILPYGDATPNRQGIIFGFSADIGNGGWLKPQASYVLNTSSLGMREVQPDYILSLAGAVPVDGNPVIRTFGGYEGALTMDLAKALSLQARTYSLQFDYKNQTTDLGNGASPFTVNTLIAAGDFTLPVAFLTPLIWSVAYEQTTSAGSEYVLNAAGSPPTLANYPFFLDNAAFGNNVNYVYQPLNLTRSTLAFGINFPFSNKINFRADYFITNYNWSDTPSFERSEKIWRFTYEAHF